MRRKRVLWYVEKNARIGLFGTWTFQVAPEAGWARRKGPVTLRARLMPTAALDQKQFAGVVRAHTASLLQSAQFNKQNRNTIVMPSFNPNFYWEKYLYLSEHSWNAKSIFPVFWSHVQKNIRLYGTRMIFCNSLKYCTNTRKAQVKYKFTRIIFTQRDIIAGW